MNNKSKQECHCGVMAVGRHSSELFKRFIPDNISFL